MQSINVAAISRSFMIALFGTAAACVGVVAVVSWDEVYAVHLLVASLLYLMGTILVTIAFHVPLNDALAAVDPGASGHWARYGPRGRRGTTSVPRWRWPPARC